MDIKWGNNPYKDPELQREFQISSLGFELKAGSWVAQAGLESYTVQTKMTLSPSFFSTR